MNKKIGRPRGRPKKTEINRFQAIAWFNAISNGLSEHSPSRLERKIQPENIRRDDSGKLVGTRAWDKYRDGQRLPKDGFKPDGKAGVVIAAEAFVPASIYIYRHPIWEVMRSKKLEFKDAYEMVSNFPHVVSRYYLDLTAIDMDSKLEAFSENIGREIWIDRDADHNVALDHLSVQLMALKLDNFRFNRERLSEIASNIAMTLGPLSVSPWFFNIYESLFDWLEENIWEDLFDKYYPRGSASVRGWRKSRGAG